MNFAEARVHFARIAAGLPEGLSLIDATTAAIVERNSVSGPACILGSKTYSMKAPELQRWRNWYILNPKFGELVGIDIAEGPNVDVVADLCAESFAVEHPDLLDRFGYVICGALLEHVERPFAAASNIVKLLRPGGVLYYNGPWVWGFHEYPNDYFRYSVEGVKALFPTLSWNEWFYTGMGVMGGGGEKIGISLPHPRLERQLFQIMLPLKGDPQTLADLISDRALPYLNVNAVGHRPVS